MKYATTVSIYALALAGLWLMLTGGVQSSWIIGAPAIVAAVVISLRLAESRPRVRVSPVGIVRFVPFFLLRCFVAGLDVARRALGRKVVLDPGWIECRTRLPDGAARLTLVNVLSLLPGTLAANLEGDRITVHLLDRSRNQAKEFAAVERAIGRAFGLRLNEVVE